MNLRRTGRLAAYRDESLGQSSCSGCIDLASSLDYFAAVFAKSRDHNEGNTELSEDSTDVFPVKC